MSRGRTLFCLMLAMFLATTSLDAQSPAPGMPDSRYRDELVQLLGIQESEPVSQPVFPAELMPPMHSPAPLAPPAPPLVPGEPLPPPVPLTDPGVALAAPIEEDWLRLRTGSDTISWLLPGDGRRDLGWATIDIRGEISSSEAKWLSINPRFAVHFLDGPVIRDLPPRLYDLSLEGVVSLPLAEDIFLQGAVAPGLYTDFDNESSDSFRIPSRLMLFYVHDETLTLSAGVAYLDREDVNVLPAAGIIWKPEPDVLVELIIPRPRIAWRTSSSPEGENWLYVAGEFGGGSWAVRRAGGAKDVATYGDLRALFGWEGRDTFGTTQQFEVGYVFNRNLEYRSRGGKISLDGTAVLQTSWKY